MRRALAASGLAGLLAACSPAPQPAAPASSPAAAPAAAPAPTAPTAPAVEAAPAATESTTQAENWDLPGTLGPMTTQAELEKRFGKANLREETFDGPEGDGSYPVLIAFPDDPAKRLELVLDADDKDAPIQELRTNTPQSQWRDAAGVHAGMTLAELVKLNGAPISFYGLDWDYGGTVQDWHGGKLANPVGSPLFRRVTLAAREGTQADLPQGDGTFRSDDPKWADAGKDLVVGELGISWPHEGE